MLALVGDFTSAGAGGGEHMTGLEKIRECMTALLRSRGVAAITAWPSGERKRLTGTVAAVSLKSCSAGPAGFRDYLGERLDPVSGKWQELYGRRVKVVFGLDLFAPQSLGEAGCQTAFDQVAEALQEGDTVRTQSLSRGEVTFERDTGLFRCPVEAACEAWLYAVADEGGAFLDFKVKGDLHGTDDT